MSEPLRCCAVGATGGWFGSVHAPSLARLAESGRVRLAAACSRSEEGRALITKKLGFARAYAGAEEMLEAEKPDYVILSMKARPMGEMALKVLERGVPLLMEKPAGHTLAAARRIAEVAARSGAPHMVAYNRRYNPLLLRVKELMAERGGVSQAVCEFLRNDVVAPSRFMGSSLHAVDALRWLLGEVRDFKGVASAARYFDRKMVAASFALAFESGVAGSFTFNVRAGRSYERYRVLAENWTATVSLPTPGKFDGRWWLRVEADDGPVELVTIEGLTACERNGPCVHGFWREHEHFVECLERGERPAPEAADGVRSMELAQRMLESVAPEQAEGEG